MKTKFVRKTTTSGYPIGGYLQVKATTRKEVLVYSPEGVIPLEKKRVRAAKIVSLPISAEVLQKIISGKQTVLRHNSTKAWVRALVDEVDLIKLYSNFGDYVVVQPVSIRTIHYHYMIEIQLGDIILQSV